MDGIPYTLQRVAPSHLKITPSHGGSGPPRDGHETSIAVTETRPRRDVCRSRDVTETLKCTFIIISTTS